MVYELVFQEGRMKVLLLAPQPFYEERGTPIAVDLLLKSLSERGDRVDVLTYHVGKDVQYENVYIHRIRKIPFIRKVPPGFSLAKIACDILLFFKVFPMVAKGDYDIIHAVEEAVFIAMLLKMLYKTQYLYDMDSSLSQQMIDKYPVPFKPFGFFLRRMEGLAIRRAKAVVPVCDALSNEVNKYHPEKVVILRDISLLPDTGGGTAEDLRQELGIDGPLMMYVGNLEKYQGIDLLLDSFALALQKTGQAHLVIIGGKPGDIDKYREIAREKGIDGSVHFLGPRPVALLSDYLKQADILVSPRVKGTNTPMKVYSYLDSGKALLATDLPTHTQVLNRRVSMLVRPSPSVFSDGVLVLLNDRELRNRLGKAGKQLIQEKHTYRVFQDNLNMLYDWVAAEIEQENRQVHVSM